MKYKLSKLLVFAAGAAIGSAVTWKLLEAKCEQRIQEEVESFKKTYTDVMSDIQKNDEKIADENEDIVCPDGTVHQINWDELEDLAEEADEPDNGMNDYAKLLNDYTSSEKGGSETMCKEPYVISPEDYGMIDGYHLIELTYYADGVLEDNYGEIVTDIDELIGRDSLFTFGEYEDDSVHVRNEKLCTDFEILRDYQTYDEVRRIDPKQVGDE